MGCGVSSLKHGKSLSVDQIPDHLSLFKPSQGSISPSHRSSIKKSTKLLMAPDMPICYLFGINEKKEDCILSFDCMTEKFTSKEVPSDLEIWNYSSALYLSADKIVLTGGINKTYSEITKKTFIYNPITTSAVPLPPMNQARYTHMSSVFEERLYVIGGRTYGSDDVALLNHVEAYDQITKKWNVLANMNKPRCTGFVCIYRFGLYVFGGYTGALKRSKLIEKYDKKKDTWDVLNFKLHRGIECGLLVSIKEDELILIGGQIRAGPTKTVVAYDFSEKTVHFKSKMSNARVLQKGFLYKDILYIFGGDNSSLVEKASINNWEWSDVPSALFTAFVSLDHIEKFSHCSPALYVTHSNQKQAKANKPDKFEFNENKSTHHINLITEEIIYLFGTDEEPFIMEFNISKTQVKNLPVPLSLHLFCYQAGAKLNDHEYFLCGGIHHQMDQIMKKAYVYSSLTHTAQVLPLMLQERYTFNCLYKNPYIYVLAGRTYGEDNEAILKRCERYNISEKKWIEIAPLNQARCSAMTFVLKNKLHLFGGYKGNGERENSIEIYDEIINKWESFELPIEEGIEASSVEVINENKVLILGGRGVSGDCSKVFMLEKKDENEIKVVEVGNIGNPRCLHKSYKLKNKNSDCILIFGGNDAKSIECFNLKKKKIEESDGVLRSMIDEFRFEIELFVGDVKLKRYLLL